MPAMFGSSLLFGSAFLGHGFDRAGFVRLLLMALVGHGFDRTGFVRLLLGLGLSLFCGHNFGGLLLGH